MKDDRLKDDEMIEILRMMAPGTKLREGLDNILRARTGALILIGDSDEVLELVDGGFYINKEFSPEHLYELAKMDGAIILSKDLKKCLYANALLIPDSSIPTKETGTRHKAAERISKQLNEVVISISQRRNLISIYKGNKKQVLRETAAIITRANQALQTLEKYRAVLNVAINNLGALEFEDIVSLEDVVIVIQRIEMVLRIVKEIEMYISELGNEGRLISMQLEELKSNVNEEGILVIEDYMINEENRTSEEVRANIKKCIYDENMDLSFIGKALGYNIVSNNMYDVSVSTKGYRLLSKVPRLPASIAKKVVEKFGDFQAILNASIEELDDVEGIGEIRAKAIKEGIRRIQEQIILDNWRNR